MHGLISTCFCHLCFRKIGNLITHINQMTNVGMFLCFVRNPSSVETPLLVRPLFFFNLKQSHLHFCEQKGYIP
jgi:hypothetical protein